MRPAIPPTALQVALTADVACAVLSTWLSTTARCSGCLGEFGCPAVLSLLVPSLSSSHLVFVVRNDPSLELLGAPGGGAMDEAVPLRVAGGVQAAAGQEPARAALRPLPSRRGRVRHVVRLPRGSGGRARPDLGRGGHGLRPAAGLDALQLRGHRLRLPSDVLLAGGDGGQCPNPALGSHTVTKHKPHITAANRKNPPPPRPVLHPTNHHATQNVWSILGDRRGRRSAARTGSPLADAARMSPPTPASSRVSGATRSTPGSASTPAAIQRLHGQQSIERATPSPPAAAAATAATSAARDPQRVTRASAASTAELQNKRRPRFR
eukprot:SAG22_NODE_363_length_11694_cov_40.815783_3_plen_323_part_00